MVWTTPRTWVTSELVTAAQLNTHVRDNLNVLRTTRVPIWVPVTDWSLSASTGHNTTSQGSAPESAAVILMGASNVLYYEALVPLPGDWISGGITWTVHFKKSTAAGGDFVLELDYGHIAVTEDLLAVGANLDVTFTPTDTTNYQTKSLGTSVAPSALDLIRLVFRRDGVAGADTSADVMQFLGMSGAYT